MREMIDKLSDEYLQSTFVSPNRLKCNVEMSNRLKASPDLWFIFWPDLDTRAINFFVNGLMLDVDNEIAHGTIVVDRV